jgi:hypothetical protein
MIEGQFWISCAPVFFSQELYSYELPTKIMHKEMFLQVS